MSRSDLFIPRSTATDGMISTVAPGSGGFERISLEVRSLSAGETFQAGNWSSYPPHKHDVHNPPHEVDLEEIYYYRTRRLAGYAIQQLYTRDRSLDETFVARDGDVVLIPEGYHPVVAGFGYDVYYLNILAGSARSMAASDDPDHAGVRSTWLVRKAS